MNKLFNLLFLSVILISFHSFCNSQDYTKKSIMMFGHSKLSLLLTKHHDGFCLWDTETTDKKVINSPLGIDVLAKLRESCDKYGIKLALYYSEGDFNWPGAVDGGRDGGTNPGTKKAQLKELVTNYGPIEFFWMDHAIGDGGLSHRETLEWIHRFQPNCFIGFNTGEAAGRLDLRERGRPGPIGDRNAVWKKHHFKEG